ncbi:hypothetical protein ACMZOO_11460 [Catenovulum sp. SX2]|uniref:hypothetical protein n=1 Tax=Catenovulum sp. SX2 TaxID=3398614 RepID=UPI003F858657
MSLSNSTNNELRIHIGAHKTATTHIQDTLKVMKPSLEQRNIHYISREEVRPRISRINPWGIEALKDKFRPRFLKKKLVDRSLLFDVPDNKTIVFSEENILGSAVDGLSEHLYPNLEKKLQFIKLLSEDYKITLFLSIRGFDAVLPGLYVTALRFHPIEATKAKNALTLSLAAKKIPSWLGIIKRIKATLPNIELKIWTQEDYRQHADFIISEFVGQGVETIPKLPKPVQTMTPTKEAITQAEALIAAFERPPNDWLAQCDSLYQSKTVNDNKDKYTFLEQAQVKSLREQYNKDLQMIERLWPNSIIKAGG